MCCLLRGANRMKIRTLNKLVMQRQMDFGFMCVLLFHTFWQSLVFYMWGSNSFFDEVLRLLPCIVLFRYINFLLLTSLQTDFFSCFIVAGSYAELRKVNISFVLSVCSSDHHSAWNTSALIGRNFMTFNIRIFFENLSRKFKFYYNITRSTSVLLEGLCTYLLTYLLHGAESFLRS